MNDIRPSHSVDLQAMAKQIMQENGFTPGFPRQSRNSLRI